MSQPDYDSYIHNFLNDVTTALPYSDYIRANIGNYVILTDKQGVERPYVVKGIKFRHTVDTVTRDHAYIIECLLNLEGTLESAYFRVALDQTQILQCMDNPMVLIDLINAHLRQKLKFIAKNKTTDLLFKNEG